MGLIFCKSDKDDSSKTSKRSRPCCSILERFTKQLLGRGVI